MKEKLKKKKELYVAPKMEAAGFNVEQGYAASTSVNISMVSGDSF